MAIATPAAVTMFVAPGPMDEVATMICRRFDAFANAVAAWDIKLVVVIPWIER